MVTQQQKAEQFLELHHKGPPLLMPNAWDVGSARLFASLGFAALATTSGGFAATLGRLDGGVTAAEALAHAAAMAAATDVPVSADLENCFADDAAGVAVTIEGAVAAGLAGCSVEDFTRKRDDPIYDLDLAAARVEAAAEAAHRGPVHLVLTARAENYLHGRPDLDDTITRLQRYQEAGADVLFAPGVVAAEDIRRLVGSVDKPVSVLALPGCPPVAELEALGVRRVSVGGALTYAAYGTAMAAARELQEHGTYSYWDTVKANIGAIRTALQP
jgi:2-methylisocitrate lyase-like PEP mutase family enzyme